MRTIARHIVDGERDGFHELVEPKDAATLIITDRSSARLKVLLGQRHARHVFMPGKFVFPGGRVDPADASMPVAAPLLPPVERRLLHDSRLKTAREAQALALAAIRETFEETGLVIGSTDSATGEIPSGPWAKFASTGYFPTPSALQLVARAITPPGFPRRFDARFFCADATAIAHKLEGIVHAEAELVALTWLPIAAAMTLDLPVITSLVLEEMQSRLDAGFDPELPVPFYCTRDGEFVRTLIN